MLRRRHLRFVAASLVAGGLLAGAPVSAQDEERNYILATASTGGTYYPVGVALATLAKVRLQNEHGIAVSAISSAGSGENVRLLREDEAQFAILQGLFGYYARTGSGPFEADGPQEELRSITRLWGNVEQFIIPTDSVQSGTVSDLVALKGQEMAMGAQNSGTIGSNRTLLSGLGIDMDTDYELFYAGYGPSAEALQNGQVAGMGAPGGVPTGAISQLLATAGDGVTMLQVTDEEAAAMDNGRNLWTRFVIDPGTYPGLDNEVVTISQPNFLAVRSDVSDEDVYLFTKAMYENLPFLQAIHPATNQMSLDVAVAGLPFPLHPGALRFYEEVGVTVPEHLRGG